MKKNHIQNNLIQNKARYIKIAVLCVFMLFFVMLFGRKVQAAEKFGEFYELQDGYIIRILPETTLQDFKNNMENQNIEVTKEDGQALQNDEYVGSAMTAKIGNDVYKLSVIGDVDGNGKISETDASKIKLHKNNLIKLEDKYVLSVDLNNDGKVGMTDLVQISQVKVKLRDIVAPESFEPETTATLNSITIEGNTTDKLNEYVEYFFRLDNGEWVQNADKTNGSYKFTNVDGLLVHEVVMKVIDQYGNQKKTKIISIGLANGEVKIIPSKTEWTNKDIEILLELESNAPDVEKYISVDDGVTFVKYTGPIKIRKNAKVVGKLESPKYGIVAQSRLEITNIDKLNPEEFNITATTNGNTITVNAIAEDAASTSEYGSSGIKEYQYTVIKGDIELTQKTSQKSYTFTNITEEGDYEVEVIAIDNAGNKTKSTTTVNVDFKFDVILEYNNATSKNGENSIRAKYGDKYGELPSPERKYYLIYNTNCDISIESEEINYNFLNWYKEQAFINPIYRTTIVDSFVSHKIYAKWEEAIKQIRLANIERTGYTFEGWYEDEGCTTQPSYNGGDTYTITTPLTEDKNLYAKWTPNKYTIKFNGNNATLGTMADEEFEYDKLQELNPNLFTREGYKFKCWNTEEDGTGTDFDNLALISNIATGGEIQLYAQWEPEEYLVEFVYNDATSGNGEKTRYVYFGEEYGKDNALPDPDKEFEITFIYNTIDTEGNTRKEELPINYGFEGWYLDENCTQKVIDTTPVTIAQSHKLYAKWEDKKVLAPNPGTKDNHTFIGWYNNPYFTGNKYDVNDEILINSNQTMYAKWKGIDINVTFDYNGATEQLIDGIKVEYNTAYANLPQLSTKKYTVTYDYQLENLISNETEEYEYTFDGWYLDENFADGTKVTNDSIVEINTDHTLYAKWIGAATTITVKEFDAETYEEYNVTFAGWQDSIDRNTYSRGQEYTLKGNVTFRAMWTLNESTLTVDPEGGAYSGETSITRQVGSKVTLGSVGNKPGHTFKGWQVKEPSDRKGTINGLTYTFGKDNTTVIPIWEKEKYDVLFSTDGGSTVPKQTVEYGDTVTQPEAPTKEHYTFAGWYENEGLTIEYDFNNKIYATTTIYAKWELKKTTLTIDPGGGAVQILNNNDEVIETIYEPKEFEQQYGTALKFKAINIENESRQEDVTIYYHLNKATKAYINTYEVPIDTDTDTVSDTVKRTIKLTSTFNNWELPTDLVNKYNQNNINIDYVFEDDSYTIKANCDVVESNTFENARAAKAERTFNVNCYYNYDETEPTSYENIYLTMDGWCLDEECNDVLFENGYRHVYSVENIQEDGCIHVYAKWSPYFLGTRIIPPTREGYKFLGWYYDSECTDFAADIDGLFVPGENEINIYAKWRGKNISTDFDVYGYTGLQMGDIVNYNANSNGIYTYTTDYALTGENGTPEGTIFSSEDNMIWKVLGVEEDTGELLLISADGTENSLTLYSEKGFINAEDIMNEISEVYGHGSGATGARSITIDDIEQFSSYDKTSYSYSPYSSYYSGYRQTYETYNYNGSYNFPSYGTLYSNKRGLWYPQIIDEENNVIGFDKSARTINKSIRGTYYNYTLTEDYLSQKEIDTLTKDSNGENRSYWISSRCNYITICKITKSSNSYQREYNCYYIVNLLNNNMLKGSFLFYYSLIYGYNGEPYSFPQTFYTSNPTNNNNKVCPIVSIDKNVTLQQNASGEWDLVF